ncbi:MAG: Dihydroorotase [candidate division BRC1 bacterium ADurb.BinA292]|nr:MAG: Dihydroorotase [candidate division BRC1 bacterium ADurb.BinA292]
MTTYLLQGGRILDPANQRDETADLWLVEGRIATRPTASLQPDEVLDCRGLIVAPGLIDMHVHLREPGREDKETIASGTRAAAAGGFTSVCAIPNTTPVIDSQTGIKFITSRSQTDAVVNVFPYAAVTKGQKGEELTEFGDLLQAGAVGFTDDGRPIMNNQVMRRALEYSVTFDTLILDHCEDLNLAEGGVMREGELATRLGLRGWPSVAESIQVARDAELSEFTGGRIHVMHVSTRASVEIIRQARARGVRISCEVTPHHLALTVEACRTYSTNAKCNPPIGPESDRLALIEGLLDGTIEVIATDHAPHTEMEKDLMFTDAPNGIIGMETAFGVLNTVLVRPGLMTLPDLISRMTANPARLLRIDKGTLSDGADADVALLDPEQVWTVDPERLHSKARNCPWNGQQLVGRPVATFVGGELIYRDGRILDPAR